MRRLRILLFVFFVLCLTASAQRVRYNFNRGWPSHYKSGCLSARSFNLSPERWKLILRAGCFDVTNKVTFSIGQTQTVATTVANTGSDKSTNPLVTPGTAIPASASPAFGHLSSFSGNRRFQLEGRITF